MKSFELHRAVARATGEDVSVIAALGFNLVDEEPPSESDVPGQIVDWDDLPEAA